MLQTLQSNQPSALIPYPEPTASPQGASLDVHEAQLAVSWSGGGIGERRESCRNEVVALKVQIVCRGLKKRTTRHISLGLFSLVLLLPSYSWSQLMPGSMEVHWDEGAPNCSVSAQPPLQVHPYNPRTFILRENLCATFEAPFMYLLVGSARAMLIDTGDIADPNRVPLAKTVMELLPGPGSSKLPLLIVHTHRHLDHRAGDSQFAHLANVEIVGFDAGSVRRYYHFTDWPNGSAEINLGDRTVDVIPTPGHNETEVSFYDPKTGLLFSGDFLLPGRLLIDNAKAYLASAERIAALVRERPISFVLGGHIEMNSTGQLFPWESQYHPQEHVLQMKKDDLLGLPAALRSFNGFYTVNGKFTMTNSIHILTAIGVGVIAAVLAITLMLVRYLRRRKRARAVRAEVQAG